MAKITLNNLARGLRGKLEDYVFRTRTRKLGNDLVPVTFLSMAPRMEHVEWSEAQSSHRQRFKAAAAYAKQFLSDKSRREAFEKNLDEDVVAYRVLLKEFMKGIVRKME